MDQIHGDMANDLDAMAYQQNIMDVPLVATRAALYIYLNAMVTKTPRIKHIKTDRHSLLGGRCVTILLYSLT